MCGTCGCGDADGPRFTTLGAATDVATPAPAHPHPHLHPAGHGAGPDGDGLDGDGLDADARTVRLERQVLARNDELAARNRAEFAARGLLVVNLMSSPGSGKTTVLERTIGELDRPVAVIEGDQETLADGERIRAAGAPVVQVNTGSGCHLDAEMLRHGMRDLALADGALVMVENVGNLVCPALFDLGETCRVVVMSVPEGDDKPAKYPHMFRTADLVLINKVDLLPYVSFDMDRCVAQLRRLRPSVGVLAVSATRGDGMADWLDWLRAGAAGARAVPIDIPARPGV